MKVDLRSLIRTLEAMLISSERAVLVVDLDGTLIRTDLFVESILQFLKTNPLNIFRIICWLLRSRAFAKERVTEFVEIDTEYLPYETALVDYLKQEKRIGRRIILATASHRTYADKVAARRT